jgi:NRPS condensation-like uncharacterized protein
MDARRLAPPNVKGGITNLSNTCPCVIRIAPDDRAEDIMAKVAKEMKLYQQRLLSASQFVQWELPMAFAFWRWVKQRAFDKIAPRPLAATNIGITDEDCVRFGTVPVQSSYLAASAPALPTFVVALSTFRNEMTLAVGIEGDEAMKSFVRSVLTAMTEELMAFGSRHSADSG